MEGNGNEMEICCCGASTWAKVIGCIQVIVNAIISSAVILFGLINNDRYYYTGTKVLMIIILILSVFGVFTGILLIKGTIDKRIGFLRTWLVYGVFSAVFSHVNFIIGVASDTSVTGHDVISGLCGIAINAFSIVVVLIHISEIKKRRLIQFTL